MDLAGAVAHETSVFCGTITTDDGEGRWNVVPGRQRGNQKARLQAMLAARRTTQTMAIRNPSALPSKPAAAATSSSGARRGDGGTAGEKVEKVNESIGKTTHTNTQTNINSSSSTKCVRSEAANGVETCFASCCREICEECEGTGVEFVCGMCGERDEFECRESLGRKDSGLQRNSGTENGQNFNFARW